MVFEALKAASFSNLSLGMFLLTLDHNRRSDISKCLEDIYFPNLLNLNLAGNNLVSVEGLQFLEAPGLRLLQLGT